MVNSNPIKTAYKMLGMTDKDGAKTAELAEINEDAKTKAELANALGVTRQTLDNYEKDADKIPLSVLNRLSNLLKCDLETLVGSPDNLQGPTLEPCHQNTADTVKRACSDLNTISKFLDQTDGGGNQAFESEKNAAKEEIESIICSLKEADRKPICCCFGQSDSGKSTLANYILGAEILPARYNPLTSAVTVIHHRDEKPGYISPAEDSIVFGRKRDDDGKPAFSFLKNDISDYNAVKDFIIREGDHSSVLNAFATREGAYYDNDEFDYIIDEVHIYLENDALKEITLVDIPGFNSGDSNDDIGLTMNMSSADIVLYLSSAISFMRPEDITALHQILRAKNPISADDGEEILPVFVLATHASATGGAKDIAAICEGGYERIAEGVSENAGSALKPHVMGMDVFNEDLRNEFNSKFVKCVYTVAKRKDSRVRECLASAAKSLSEKYAGKISEAGKAPQPISEEERDVLLAELEGKCSRMKQDAEKQIDALRQDDCDKYEGACNAILDTDNLVSLMDKKGTKNSKKDKQDFANYVNGRINNRLTEILQESSKEFSEAVDEQLQSFGESANKGTLSINMTSFNVKRAFASGLAGVSTFGALAAWASVVAAGSNLGSYILLAKIVSALSAIGISLGGTATVATAISAIGGPVTLGIGIAVIAAVSTFGVIGGTWKKSFAKKLSAAFIDKGVLEKGKYTINKYWRDTKVAYGKCNEQLKKEGAEFINARYEQSKLDYENTIKLNVLLGSMFGTLKNFYEGIGKQQ